MNVWICDSCGKQTPNCPVELIFDYGDMMDGGKLSFCSRECLKGWVKKWVKKE